MIELQENPAKLNAQGLSRRNKLLMECIEANPGNVVISVDFSSGEPSVCGSFSKDERYIYATYSGIGKAPHYSEDILMIDDVYLAGASVSPMGRHKMKEIFNTTFNGLSFSEQWLEDDEVIKKEVKKLRSFHKILILGTMYGLKPKGMVNMAYDQGEDLSLKDAKAFYNSFWNHLFRDVGRFRDHLEKKVKRDGFLINPFGFRMSPQPRKSFNYFCQSSVSGLMHILNAKFFSADKVCEFITVIHDEVLFECPEEYEPTAKKNMEAAVKSLNDDLGWIVPIRTGWAVGKEWYTAK